MQCRNLLMCCVGMWNTKNAGKLPMLLLLVLPLLLPSLQALTLTRHVHWQLRTPLLAAQRLNARVKAWVLVAALEPWTASALPDSVPAKDTNWMIGCWMLGTETW